MLPVSRLIGALAADAARSLRAIRAARTAARERTWALAGDAAPGGAGLVTVDLDATTRRNRQGPWNPDHPARQPGNRSRPGRENTRQPRPQITTARSRKIEVSQA